MQGTVHMLAYSQNTSIVNKSGFQGVGGFSVKVMFCFENSISAVIVFKALTLRICKEVLNSLQFRILMSKYCHFIFIIYT